MYYWGAVNLEGRQKGRKGNGRMEGRKETINHGVKDAKNSGRIEI